MQAGRIRHRVILQSRSNASDAYGQPTQTWTNLGTFWARVNALSGREAERARQINAETTHQIELRYSLPIDPTMRILMGDRTFNILEVINPEERNILYKLLTVENPDGT